MYPTFNQYPTGSDPQRGPPPPTAPSSTDGNAGAAIGSVPLRPTRKQVSRACDWCRARRIKCDNGRPCRACRQRGADCTHKGTDEPRTLPQAMREVEKLRNRVRELEQELGNYTSQDRQGSASIPTPNNSDSCANASPASAKCLGKSPRNSIPYSLTPAPTIQPQWEGIYVATSGSDQTSYYGPASNFYFVGRIGTYLNRALQKPFAPRSMQPKEARTNVALRNPNYQEDRDCSPKSVPSAESTQTTSLSREQEEAFLALYWESYHCLVPIVDEVEFRRHYDRLWESGTSRRRQSALVDIILALCLQFGWSFMPRDTNDTGDPTLAGRWYYRRCQSLLTADLESPTIATVQCLIFSATYLCCATFQNIAHVTMAQAVRTAHMLGLHLEPPEDLPTVERELRKRLWWTVWVCEIKLSCKLGRPPTAHRENITVLDPSDSPEVANANGASMGTYGGVTWLTYDLQVKKLMGIVLDAHTALYSKFGEELKRIGSSSPYTDPQAMESCAQLFNAHLSVLKAWVEELPPAVKNPRRASGETFSTDGTLLEIDPNTPLWLLRQRLCLEITYHTQVMNLTRPFITFYSHTSTYTPIAERHATTCVNHAAAIVLLMHQSGTESDLMGGWSELFFQLWNAVITVAGFLLAYPIHPVTSHARIALEKGITVLNVFGETFAVAADAAKIVEDLGEKADLLAGRLRSGVNIKSSAGGQDEEPPNHDYKQNVVTTNYRETVPTTSTGPSAAAVGTGTTAAPATVAPVPSMMAGATLQEVGLPINDTGSRGDGLVWFDPQMLPGQADPNYYSNFMDWALSVDQFNTFERFFDASNPADPWQFG